MALLARVEVGPLRLLTYRMAEISSAHRVSTLGAEAVAAARQRGAVCLGWR